MRPRVPLRRLLAWPFRVVWANLAMFGYFPENIQDNPHVPPVLITDFRIFNAPVPIGPDSPLVAAITETAAITLTHDQSVISFEFHSLEGIISISDVKSDLTEYFTGHDVKTVTTAIRFHIMEV